MAVNDVYRLDLFQSYSGQRIMNSMAFARETIPNPDQAQAQALAQDWKDFLRLYQVAALSHTGWRLTQLSGAEVTYSSASCSRSGGLSFEGVYTGLLVGNHASEGLPPQSALVVTLATGLVGRSRRGRFYMSGLPENVQDAGIIPAAGVATYQTAWDGQYTKFQSGGTNPFWYAGVWSNQIATGCKPSSDHPHNITSFTQPHPELAFSVVNAYKPRGIVYTQRRRTIGVGA